MAQLPTDARAALRLIEIELELRRRARAPILEAARADLLAFTQFTFPGYRAGRHHRWLADDVAWWLATPGARLMVLMPPRHGKSELVSRRLPGLIFGQDPNAQIIASSYAQSLARSMSMDARRIISTTEYRELFPHVRLSPPTRRNLAEDGLNTQDEWQIKGGRGYYRGAGVGVGITGKGFTHGVIDDPVKGRKEADSRTVQDDTWNWYQSEFYSRRAPGARILLACTPWHPRDLRGRLLEEMENGGEQWRVVKMPAVAGHVSFDPRDDRSPGEALWPEQWPLSELAGSMRFAREWAALYQLEPTTQDGGLFKREWFDRTWEVLPRAFDEVMISVDCNYKKTSDSDYAVVQAWGRVGPDFYLLDQYRDRVTIKALCQMVRRMRDAWKPWGAYGTLVEDKANGRAVIEALQGEIGGIIEVTPTESKHSRASSVTMAWEAGNVLIPARCSWTGAFIEEHVGFTGQDGREDDQVDAGAQMLRRWLYPEGTDNVTSAVSVPSSSGRWTPSRRRY